MLSVAECAWAAGFFDGEGCVLLAPMVGGGFNARLAVPQKDRKPLEKLHGLFGGHIYKQTATIWQWRLTSRNENIRFLEQVGPYLTTKHAESAVLLEWLKQPWRGRKWGHGIPDPLARWSDTLLANLLKFQKHNKELN